MIELLAFKTMFILMLLLNHYFLKKLGNIKDAIKFVDPSNFKIIYILLIKALIV